MMMTGSVKAVDFLYLHELVTQPICDQSLYVMLEKELVGMRVMHVKKGSLYDIIALTRSTDDPHLLYISYRAVEECPEFGMSCWTRKADEFFGKVEIDGILQDRFIPISVVRQDDYGM